MVNDYIYWAQEWFNKGNWAKALEEISKAIKHSPNDGFLYHIQGDIYRSITQPQIALKKYGKAVELGYKDSKHEIFAIESVKEEAVEKYEAVLYKCFGFHFVIAVLSALAGGQIQFNVIASVCGLLGMILILRLSVSKFSKEAKALLNTSLSVNIIATILLLSFVALPFILGLTL
ncbi:hypothetical protein IM792_06125 [Mucilaginibacter sp. JRF]|uniref:tetratricopeptide repeat protein n=1 Tax=Mucilaginibacter sp. JRF TaxID=2780088 RepID=UPI00187E5304|nr:hypothetical protein [Mucilaginibacter sp. JRF]MBE9584020.1 hypothetical protein [Mucilaginibacter sp. JRF]